MPGSPMHPAHTLMNECFHDKAARSAKGPNDRTGFGIQRPQRIVCEACRRHADVDYSTDGLTLNVHILHDDTLTEENKRKLTAMTEQFRHRIAFYPIVVPEEMRAALAHIANINVWTAASLYRLYLPNVLQTEKVIYLDCDLFVNMDIAELWNIDLGEHYLAASIDQGIMGVKEEIIACGLEPSRYFNSGVILLGLVNMRARTNRDQEMLRFLSDYPHTTLPGQDVLNH